MRPFNESKLFFSESQSLFYKLHKESNSTKLNMQFGEKESWDWNVHKRHAIRMGTWVSLIEVELIGTVSSWPLSVQKWTIFGRKSHLTSRCHESYRYEHNICLDSMKLKLWKECQKLRIIYKEAGVEFNETMKGVLEPYTYLFELFSRNHASFGGFSLI